MSRKHIIGLLLVLSYGISWAQPYPASSYKVVDNELVSWTGSENKIDMTKDPVLSRVNRIGRSAFSKNRTLKEIKISKSVGRIWRAAFSYCDALEHVSFEDRDIAYDPVEVLGGAFDRCYELTSVTLPSNIQLLANPFEECPNTQVSFTSNNSNYFIRDNLVYEKKTYDLIFAAPIAKGSIEVLPQTKRLRNACFAYSSVQSIYLHNGIDTIPQQAFYKARNLKIVALPLGLKVIENASFAYTGIRTLILPEGLEEVAPYSFFGSNSLPSSIKLPSSLNKLSGDSFSGSPITKFEVHPDNRAYMSKDGSVYSVDGSELVVPSEQNDDTFVVPDHVVSIGKGAFSRTSYRSIVFPDGLREIKQDAFWNMPLLETLRLPEGLTVIGDGTGSYCPKLRIIDIPSTLTGLPLVFEKEELINRRIICRAQTPPLAQQESENDARQRGIDTLYVPRESIELYKITPGWKHFKMIKAVEELPKPRYEVRLSSGEGGDISINGHTYFSLQSVEEGSELEVVVTPNAGYRLRSLTVNGIDITESRSFIVQRSNLVKAEFETERYYVLLDAGLGGQIRINGNPSLNDISYGTELEIEVEPHSGYLLESLSIDGEDISQSRRFVVRSNSIVQARFKKQEFTIRLYQSEGGRIDVSGNDTELKVPLGTEIEVNAYPDDGYEFVSLFANGEEEKNIRRFRVTENIDFRASFVRQSYPVTLNYNLEGGLIRVVGYLGSLLSSVPYGSQLELEVQPAIGYELSSLQANDESIISSLVFWVTGPTVVRGLFSRKSYSLSTRTHGSGSIRLLGVSDINNVPHGSRVGVEVIPSEGYELSSLYANGVDILESKSFEVTDYVDVVATFSLRRFPLTITENSHAEVKILGADNLSAVEYGRTLELLPRVDTGFVLNSVLLNGQELKPPYRFEVREPINISVLVTQNTGVDYVSQGPIRVYPNPAHDYLRISGVTHGTLIKILHISGKVTLEVSLDSELLYVGSLPRGSYLVLVDGVSIPLVLK